MKSQSLSELIKNIFSDEATKAQFATDPGIVMDQYSLTQQEREAVLRTYNTIGLETNASVQLKAEEGPMSSWV